MSVQRNSFEIFKYSRSSYTCNKFAQNNISLVFRKTKSFLKFLFVLFFICTFAVAIFEWNVEITLAILPYVEEYINQKE